MVTSFRVGMSDPIWPTEPWYLFFIRWSEPDAGFLIEHIHRLAGFTVGGVVSILAIGLWWTEKRKAAKWIGLVALVVLLGEFGRFHGLMMKQVHEPKVTWPMIPLISMGVSLAVVVLIAITGNLLRLLGVLALVGVMIQGLLGGLRVRLNELFGTDLAMVHGIFAQVVFALLVTIAVLTARRKVGEEVLNESRLRFWTLMLVGSAFIQLVWGAMVRHHGTSVMQRLHFMTAFVVFGFALWTVREAMNSRSWPRWSFTCKLLMGFLAFQILLGVEAWMGKFYGTLTPELDMVTKGKALTRSLHVLFGTGVLAISTVLAVLVRRSPLAEDILSDEEVDSMRGEFIVAESVGGRT